MFRKRGNQKRGQLTIFIIIAIVLLFSVLVYFFIVTRESEVDVDPQKSGPAGEVYNYVEKCINDAAFSASELFGRQQGYHIVPFENSVDTAFYRMAYYYLEGATLIPPNEFFDGELSKIIDDEIEYYCSDFSDFEGRYDISSGKVESKVTIFEDNVVVNVNYPISIRNEDTATEISRFSYTLQIRLKHLVDVSRTLVEEIKKEPYSIDLTLFLNQDVGVSVVNYDTCTQVYLLEDEESETNTGEPYFFSFAVGFNEEFCFEREDVGSAGLDITT